MNTVRRTINGVLVEHTINGISIPAGLGDRIAAVATPIARVLRLPCIDPATGQLRPEAGCSKRRKQLNERFPLNNKH